MRHIGVGTLNFRPLGFGVRLHRLTLATLASPSQMGQQVYENEIVGRAALELGEGWRVQHQIIRSMRSPLAGTARVPARFLQDSGPRSRRLLGLGLAGGAGVTHRFDLRIPRLGHHEALTIHDVVSWRFPDEARPPRASMEEANRAEVVICPSAFSAEEVSRVLKVKEPLVIHNGVSPRFLTATPLAEEELRMLGVRSPFVLHTGGSGWRKNLHGLASAWPTVRRARPGTTLVLVGPPSERRDLLFGTMDGAVRLGRVDETVLPGLLAAAQTLVVPSIYEGFGLPALEGMASGVPVVAACRSSLPEVCGQAALLVEPSGEGLAEGIIAALDGGTAIADNVRAGRERARKFSWVASCQAHAEVWRALT